MIELGDIRAAVQSAVQASSSFSTATVIVDDGYMRDEIAAADRSGVVVLIGVFDSVTPAAQGAGAMSATADFIVTMIVNPDVQQTDAIDVDILLHDLVAAIIDIEPGDDNDRFTVGQISNNTAESGGPLTYQVPVSKRALIER